MPRLLLLCLLFLFPLARVWAQVVISGRVVDERQQPLPFASVTLPDGSTGTATNEAGEFRLRVPAPAAELLVFSLGYERKRVPMPAAGQPLTVVLPTSAQQLPEVRVSQSEQARELARRAYAKLLRHQNSAHYGKAFYRQKTKQGGRYREFFDAFCDVQFTNQKINGWDLGEARYAKAKDAGIDFKNFSSLTRQLPVYRTAADQPSKVPVPLSPQGLEQFRFTLESYFTEQGRELAVVAYSYPLAGNAGTCSGKLYIDPATAALHRLEFKIPSAFMLTLKTQGPATLHPDDALLHLTRDFVPVADSLTRLASTRVEQHMRFENKKGFAEEVQVSSHFLIYQPTLRLPEQRYAAMEQSVNDLEQISKRPYNPQFWRDNEIIRASPVEEQIIRDLEGQQVFGKI